MVATSSLKMLAAFAMVASASAALTMSKVGGFSSARDEPLEIIATKTSTNHLFVASTLGVTILELGTDLTPVELGFYDAMSTFGEPTSVAYNPVYDELAISVASHDTLTKGMVYIVSSVEDWMGCDYCDTYVQTLTTGYLPDMVTFTPDGRRILTANEGEALDYTSVENDPEGSVSIFKRQWKTKTYEEQCQLDFEKYNKPYRTNSLVERGVRKGGKNFTTMSMDMEPEYIAVTESGNTAYITLQENNAVLKVDIKGCRASRVYALGYKEWGNGMMCDASDKDGEINLDEWPQVKGMYMPDAITTFKADGTRYFITANEGDSREYGEEDSDDYFTDEIRVGDLAAEMGYDSSVAPYNDDTLGRLKVTTSAPFEDNMDELYAFGGRSISIFHGKTGELVWDSGDFMEQYTANEDNGFSALFNSQGNADSFDGRSDDKGPEPEGLVMAEIDGRMYVFAGLERIGGWMCWDVSDPTAPVFQSYTNSYEDDSGPESAVFIPAEDSPSGTALLISAFEASNTLAVYEVTVE